MDRRIRAGVIGVGAFGSLHAKVYAESEFADLVAVADVNPECLNNLAAGDGVDRYEDLHQLLDRDDIDVVNVCTTDRLHLEPVLAAAQAGKHILVEKPLAYTVEDCDSMIRAARAAGVKLMVGQILRFDPRYCAAQQAIEDGRIGELVHVYARRNNSIASALARADKTSVLYFLGVHDIYFVNWCAAAKVETVFGVSHQKVLTDFETPDTTLALLKYENGMIASLEFSWVLPSGIPSRIEARFEAVGTRGQINIDGGNPTLEVVEADGISAPDTAYAPEVEDRTVGVLRDELYHFVDCVRNDREPAITGEDGREAVRVVCAIAESALNGRPVHL